MAYLCHSLSDIKSQTGVVPGSLELRTPASLTLGRGEGEKSRAAHSRGVFPGCSSDSAGARMPPSPSVPSLRSPF